MIKELTVSGFRGFGIEQTIKFSLPDDEHDGSGLSIIIGANNSGKTTIIEAIKAFNQNGEDISFSEGRRNKRTGSKVTISYISEDDNIHSIQTINTGGSATVKNNTDNIFFYIVPSRRAFEIYFHASRLSKNDYIRFSLALENTRTSELQNYGSRIIDANKNKTSFDPLIKRILGKDFNWCLEQSDQGKLYIKYIEEEITYSGEGVGDGIWSIFTICSALFDSKPHDTIVIDEPELSVHPALQRKIIRVLIEYSKNRQIIISTHSPYFVDWNAIKNGASLIRVSKDKSNTVCHGIDNEVRGFASQLITDTHNPHILGLNAVEALFMEDNLVLVEGQEDVVIYSKALRRLGIDLEGDFFGWGAGGEPKMPGFLHMFDTLGYKKIVAIYDGDKKEEAKKATERYPQYSFHVIPEDDVRDKENKTIPTKIGIADKHWNIKPEYQNYVRELFEEINEYLSK